MLGNRNQRRTHLERDAAGLLPKISYLMTVETPLGGSFYSNSRLAKPISLRQDHAARVPEQQRNLAVLQSGVSTTLVKASLKPVFVANRLTP